MTKAKIEICLCAGCNEMLHKGDDLVQNPIYKMGELDYIELAHRACLPQWAVNDDWTPSEDDLDGSDDLAAFDRRADHDCYGEWDDPRTFAEWMDEGEFDAITLTTVEPRQAVRLKTKHSSEIGYAKSSRRSALRRGKGPKKSYTKIAARAANRGERHRGHQQERDILAEAREVGY